MNCVYVTVFSYSLRLLSSLLFTQDSLRAVSVLTLPMTLTPTLIVARMFCTTVAGGAFAMTTGTPTMETLCAKVLGWTLPPSTQLRHSGKYSMVVCVVAMKISNVCRFSSLSITNSTQWQRLHRVWSIVLITAVDIFLDEWPVEEDWAFISVLLL